MLADHAAALAGLGWHTFPVRDKQPLVPWRDRSTLEPAPLFAEWPSATGIGVDCGKSGLVVLDIDDLDQFATWFAGLDVDLPVTLTAQTQSGGKHLYFVADPARPIRNSASKLAPGVDMRGDGGYVVCPPSPGYTWTSNVAPVPVPEWLHEACAPPARGEPAPAAPTGAALPTALPGDNSYADRWGQRILDAEFARIATAAPGTRNVTFFESACNVLEAVKGGHVDEQYAMVELTRLGEQIGLDPDEVGKSLDSADARTVARHPKEELRGPAASPVSGGTIAPVRLPQQAPSAGMQVMSLDEIDDLPPPRWLLNRRLPEGMTVIYGKPGAGKTFVALDWCLTVAAHTGQRVLYFAGEGVSGFRDRTRAWRGANAGRDVSTFSMVPQVPMFLAPESLAEFRTVVADQKPALVVIDTLARALVGGDENSATDVGLLVRTLDELRLAHGTSSLILHHTNVAGDRERGSGALRGAADCMWKATPDLAGGLTLSCDKLKDGEYPGESHHRFRAIGPSVVLHPLTSSQIGGGEEVPI